MTENTHRTRWGIIVAGVVVAIALIALLVYVLVQGSTGDSNEAANPTTTESPESTNDPDASDGGGDDGAADGEDGSSDGQGDAGTGDAAGPANYLPEEMNGQEAIDALGDDIDEVAERNGKSADDLKELLLRDKTAHITPDGFIVYRDTFSNDG